MSTTFTEAKNALDEIAARETAASKRLDNAKADIAAALADLTAMATDYSTIIGDIDAAVVANPTNTAWLNAQAEKNQMVSDFQAAKARANTMNTAVSSL